MLNKTIALLFSIVHAVSWIPTLQYDTDAY